METAPLVTNGRANEAWQFAAKSRTTCVCALSVWLCAIKKMRAYADSAYIIKTPLQLKPCLLRKEKKGKTEHVEVLNDCTPLRT